MSRRSRPFSSIRPQAIEWIWREHIPAGMLSVIGGPPGVGKSLVTFHIASEVSHRGHVLVSNTEDRLRETSRPRMAAAGADLDRVHFFDPRLPALPEGLPQLAAEVRGHEARLVILDPWSAHTTIPQASAGLLRTKVLDPLEELCESTGCAALIVTHQIKAAGPKSPPLMTVGGPAAGLIGAARAVFLLGKNPADPEEVALAPAKFNLGPAPSSLGFELDEAIDPENEGAGRLLFRGEIGVSAAELVRAQYQADERLPSMSKSERAQEWLAQYLWAARGPCKPSDVVEDARRLDPPITAKQLRDAASKLGATNRRGGRGATWDLPDELREMLDVQYREEDPDE